MGAIRMVLSLILLNRDQDQALNAEAVTHLWYSSRMPLALWKHIKQAAVARLFRATRFVNETYFPDKAARDDSRPITVRIRPGQSDFHLTFTFTGALWDVMESFCQVPVLYTSKDSEMIRWLDIRNGPPVYDGLVRMTPSRAAGYCRWINDGLMLPFDHPREAYTVLNP